MKCVFSAFPKALLWLFMLYWALLCGIVCLANPPKATLLALAALPVLVCVGQGLTAWEKRTPKLFWNAFAVLAAVFFAAAALYALEARIRLPSDTDILYASVGDLLRDGVLNETNPNMELYYPGMGLVTNADYFCMYYNNIAALLMLFAAYRLMPGYIPGTAQGQTPALLLAVLCMAVTVLLLCAAVYRLTRRGSAAMLTLLLCCVFQPFYFGLVNFYTDILMLPFAVGGAAALAGAVIILTGIVGSLMGETVCKVCHITDPLAKGLALGTSAHAIGTSKALQMGEVEGAMSGLAIAVAGIMTAILAPVVANFLP